MTPYLFKLATDAYMQRQEKEYNHDVWLMWHNAALGRMKKMTPLSDFYKRNKKPSKKIDEAGIIARLKAYNKRLESEDGRR